MSELKGLNRIHFTHNIDDQPLSSMVTLPIIETLAVSSKSLTGGAVATAVRNLPGLKRLSETVSAWTAEDLKQLPADLQLEYLDLRGNKLTADAIQQYAAAHPRCRLLTDHGTFEPQQP